MFGRMMKRSKRGAHEKMAQLSAETTPTEAIQSSCFGCINFGRRRTSSEREMLRDAYLRLVASPEHAKLTDELTRFGEGSTPSTAETTLISVTSTSNAVDASDSNDRFASVWRHNEGNPNMSTVSARDVFTVSSDHPTPANDNNPLATGLVHTMMALGALDIVGTMCSRRANSGSGGTSDAHRRHGDAAGGPHIKAANGKTVALSAKKALKVGGAAFRVGRMATSGSSGAPSRSSGPPTSSGGGGGRFGTESRARVGASARNMRSSKR